MLAAATATAHHANNNSNNNSSDYNNNNNESSTACAIMSGAVLSSSMPIIEAGSCDAVAVWVDYELLPGLHLRSYDGHCFPLYLTANVKFFPASASVHPGDSVLGETRFEVRKSDFSFEFCVVNKYTVIM